MWRSNVFMDLSLVRSVIVASCQRRENITKVDAEPFGDKENVEKFLFFCGLHNKREERRKKFVFVMCARGKNDSCNDVKTAFES
jgi:hypothetical protein